MAQTVVDEVMLREPRLLVPGLQPQSLVRPSGVAKSSRAALVGIVRRGGPGANRNLMDGTVGCTLIACPFVNGRAGVATDDNEAGGSIEPAYWLNGKELVTTGPFSILWHGVVLANTNGYAVFSNRGGANQWRLMPNWASNGDEAGSQTANSVALLIYETAFSGVSIASAFTYGVPCTVVATRQESTVLKIFVDGRKTAAATVTSRNVSGSTPHQIGISQWDLTKYTSIGSWGPSSSYQSNTQTYAVAFWNVGLPDGLALELSGNPYLLVEPA